MDASHAPIALIDLNATPVPMPSVPDPHASAGEATGARPPTPAERINGHSASFEDERARLEVAIAEARARASAAVERRREREAEARRAMRAEVEATRNLIAELEQRHREALALIEETAELEIARLRAERVTADAADPDDRGSVDGSSSRG